MEKIVRFGGLFKDPSHLEIGISLKDRFLNHQDGIRIIPKAQSIHNIIHKLEMLFTQGNYHEGKEYLAIY